MKFILMFLALGTFAHAVPFVYSITGSNATKSFTAEITVETNVPDGDPDPKVGRYAQTTPSLVQFSDGLTLSNQPFEYVTTSAYYNSAANITYDSLSFYFYQPTYTFGIELRFTPGTFANDFAITPTFSSLTPDTIGGIAGTDWFINGGRPISFGDINSISVASANVPEGGPTAGLLLLPLATLALLTRQRFRKTA